MNTGGISLIPQDWLTSVGIHTAPEKEKCQEMQITELMSWVLNILLNIVHARIYQKLEEYISRFQLGFRTGLDTGEALFSFIDSEKAFANVQNYRKSEKVERRRLEKLVEIRGPTS